MSQFYKFEQKRFQQIVAAYLNHNCNFQEMPIALKKQMRVYIHDNIPHLWLGDGYNFIEGHFTKDAINEFRKNFNTMKFSYLKDKILVITKWRLVSNHVDSRTCFTSFQNLSVQLVVEQFRPMQYEKPTPRQVNVAKNLFRDSEIQSLIRHQRHQVLQRQVLQKHFFYNMPDFQMPSAKDLFRSEASHLIRKLPERMESEDVLMLSDDSNDESTQVREQEREETLQLNKVAFTKIAGQISANEVIMCQTATLHQDLNEPDFQEFRDSANGTGNTYDTRENVLMMGDTAPHHESQAIQRQYYDVKRLIIQEKGEDDYQYIFERKHQQLIGVLEDEYTREELTSNLEHYSSKHQSRLDFQKQLQLQYKLKEQKQQNKKKHKRVVEYRIGIKADEIKDKILRFMATFNPAQKAQGESEQIIELRDDDETVEPRGRAYSQELIDRNDRSELLETKTVVSQFGGYGQNAGGYALSQYVCQQSVLNGDVTESENEEDEFDLDPMAVINKRKLKEAMSEVKPSMALFKRYIEWFAQNDVSTKHKHESYMQQLKLARVQAEEERIEKERSDEISRIEEQKRLDGEHYRQEQAILEKQRQAEFNEKLKLRKHEEEKEARQRRMQQKQEEEVERLRELEEQKLQKIYEQEEHERLRVQKEEEQQLQQRLLEQERLRILKQQEQEVLKKKLQEEQEQERLRLAEEARVQEEALRRQEIEQLEAERKELQERDRLRKEKEQRAWEKQELERREFERSQQSEQLKREEKRRRHELEAQEIKRLKFQAQKDKLKRECEETMRLSEEKKQREAAKKLAELELQSLLKLRQEEEELARRTQAANEAILAENRRKEELVRLAIEAESQRQRVEYQKRLDLEASQKRQYEEKRRAEIREQEAAAERQRQYELIEDQRRRVAAQDLDNKRRSMMVQSIISDNVTHELDDKSDCSSIDGQNERTPAFQNDPSDNELQNDNSINFLTENSATSSQQHTIQASPQFADTTTNSQEQQVIVNQITDPQSKLHKDESDVNLGKRSRKSGSKKRKASSSSSSAQSSIDESQSSDNESEQSHSGSSSNSSVEDESDSDNEEVKKLMLKLLKKQSKDKKKKKKSSTTVLLASLLSTMMDSNKRSSKKSSSMKKLKTESRNSSEKKKKKSGKERIPSAFTLDQYSPATTEVSASVQAYPFISKSPTVQQNLHSNVQPSSFLETQAVEFKPRVLISANPTQAGGLSMSPELKKKDAGMTSFEAWKQSTVSHPMPAGAENVPDNGQQRNSALPTSQDFKLPKPIVSRIPDQTVHALPPKVEEAPHKSQVIEELEELQYYAQLGGTKKRQRR